MTTNTLTLDEMTEALRPLLPADMNDSQRRDVARALIDHITDGIASGGNLAFLRDGEGGRIEMDVLTLQKIL